MTIKNALRYLLPKPVKKAIRTSYLRLADIFHDEPLIPKPSERFFVGGGFIGVGLEFMNYFINIGGLKPYHKVLDIGCGIGRIAIPLTAYLSSQGEYWGFDIVKSGITWAQKNITNKHNNFHFDLVDIYNKAYNPNGGLYANAFSFPYPQNYYDFTYAVSVFTHLIPEDAKNYLKEISRVLKSGGTSFVTFFLFDNNAIDKYKKSGLNLKYEIECFDYKCLVQDIDVPEQAIAYDLEFISNYIDEIGLRIDNIYYGAWSGRDDYLTAQDILIIRKK